jgi:hypothetical protein
MCLCPQREKIGGLEERVAAVARLLGHELKVELVIEVGFVLLSRLEDVDHGGTRSEVH